MVVERPSKLERDERGRLHSLNGASISWPDGWGLYSVNGVRVPAQVIEQPESITVADIESEQNAEVRRVMLDRYGLDRFLRESGAQKVQQDRFGELYARALGGLDYRFVRVLNSTPEPDGTYKSYVLQVDLAPNGRPPKSAHEAVAATFGLTPEEYGPVWES